MKKVSILVLSIIISFSSYGQLILQQNNSTGISYDRFQARTYLGIPKGLGGSGLMARYDTGDIRYNVSDSNIYIHTGYQWIKINGSGSSSGLVYDLQRSTDSGNITTNSVIAKNSFFEIRNASNNWIGAFGKDYTNSYGSLALSYPSGSNYSATIINPNEIVLYKASGTATTIRADSSSANIAIQMPSSSGQLALTSQLGSSSGWSLTGNTGLTGSNYIGSNSDTFNVKTNGVVQAFFDRSKANYAIGNNALSSVTTGIYNVALGYNSLLYNYDGVSNTSIGSGSLSNNIDGSYNAGVGRNSLYSNQSGSGNIGLGYSAGSKNFDGNYQLFISSIPHGTYYQDTTRSLIYGQMGSDSSGQRFKINGRVHINDGTQNNGYVFTSDSAGIGHWAPPGAGSSQWHDNASGIDYTAGLVGIGTTTPAYDLDVNGTIGAGGLYISADGEIGNDLYVDEDLIVTRNIHSTGYIDAHGEISTDGNLSVSGRSYFADSVQMNSPIYRSGSYAVRWDATTHTLVMADTTLAFDSSSLSARIDQKLNANDTSHLSDRINQKLNKADSIAGGYYPYSTNPKGYLTSETPAWRLNGNTSIAYPSQFIGTADGSHLLIKSGGKMFMSSQDSMYLNSATSLNLNSATNTFIDGNVTYLTANTNVSINARSGLVGLAGNQIALDASDSIISASYLKRSPLNNSYSNKYVRWNDSTKRFSFSDSLPAGSGTSQWITSGSNIYYLNGVGIGQSTIGSGYSLDVRGKSSFTSSDTLDADNFVVYNVDLGAALRVSNNDRRILLNEDGAYKVGVGLNVPNYPLDVSGRINSNGISSTGTDSISFTSGSAYKSTFKYQGDGWHILPRTDMPTFGTSFVIGSTDTDTTSYLATDVTNQWADWIIAGSQAFSGSADNNYFNIHAPKDGLIEAYGILNYNHKQNYKDTIQTTLILPASNATYDIGSTAKKFKEGHFSDSICIGSIRLTDSGYAPGKILTLDGTGKKATWQTSFDSTSLSSRINTKLNISDTGAMFSAYRTSINSKLSTADTGAMFSAYRTSINTKLNTSDSSGMLSAYRTSINTNKTRIDSASAAIQSRQEIYNVQALTTSPADGADYYFGQLPKVAQTTAGISKIYFRKAGVITGCNIYSQAGTAGDNQSWTIALRLNNTTDYNIAAVSLNTTERVWNNTGMTITVAAGDYIEVHSLSTTWATSNPASVIFGGYILFTPN